MTDTDLYSLEVGYAFEAKTETIRTTIKGKPVTALALVLDEAGDIIWDRVDDPMTPLGLEDTPTFTGTYGEVSERAMSINEQMGRGRGVTFFPHPIAKLAA